MKRDDDLIAAVLTRAAVETWARQHGLTVRIDWMGVLSGTVDYVAIVTDVRSGRQGIWPTAWPDVVRSGGFSRSSNAAEAATTNKAAAISKVQRRLW